MVEVVRLAGHPDRRGVRPGREVQAAPLLRRRCLVERDVGLLGHPRLRHRRADAGLLGLRHRRRQADVGLPDRHHLLHHLAGEEALPVPRRRPRRPVVEEALLERRRRHHHLAEPELQVGVGRRPQARQQREEAVATVAR